MATIRFTIQEGLVIFCSECKKPLNHKDFYFVHRCKSIIEHALCRECILASNTCKKCKLPLYCVMKL